MRQWLVICLRAPLASFGENAGNAERGTADMPTRSALIGLAGAALGIERADEAGQARLVRSLVTAAALYDRGHPLADFHTYTSLHQSAKGAATRAAALERKEYLATSISRRHYRAGGVWQAAYRLSDSADGFSLADLATAFDVPRFVLYLGRKSCPPSHPLVPRLIEGETVVEAFHTHFEMVAKTFGRGLSLKAVSVEDRHDGPRSNRPRTHLRQDDPRDRSKRWTFGQRQEWRFAITPDAGRGGEV
ncbi:MAG: type I-E CRISPR-associated protein Cas5/CasD [Shinella sp.]|nr:MAG: type I-E CRISPR-associated protein Cas5/CasD [Shinella sp.]